MTIEGNKDEADKCIEIARSAFAAGDAGKAERFLLKAERLYPSKEAQDLLSRVRAGGAPGPRPRTPPPAEAPRRRAPAAPSHDYSVEQIEAVRRVNKCKDYYEILAVTKEAKEGEIKKAYKKLALQLHPDKNRAPGAAEAFKAIGNAAAILTDPAKRAAYDARGEEPPARTHHQYYARGFESDLTAEELFNMFFGANAFPGAGGHVWRASTRRAREPEPREAPAGLLQLLPVLALVLLSMLSGLFISEPVYSLAPSPKHPVPRETANLKVPYYVKDNFHTDYQGSLRRLEMSIEEEYIVNLRHACQRERNYRDSMAWKARNFGDSRQYAEAQKLRTPSCEKLQSFHRESAARMKHAKYSSLVPGYELVPFAVETAGAWGAEAKAFVAELGRRLRQRGCDPRSGSYLVQRISVASQRGNAAGVMGTFGSGMSRDGFSI